MRLGARFSELAAGLSSPQASRARTPGARNGFLDDFIVVLPEAPLDFRRIFTDSKKMCG